jgi:hypothetical protein
MYRIRKIGWKLDVSYYDSGPGLLLYLNCTDMDRYEQIMLMHARAASLRPIDVLYEDM